MYNVLNTLYILSLSLSLSLSFSAVEKVRSQWDSTQHGVEARLQQLDNMIGHSNQWEEQRQELKALIGQKEGRLHNLMQLSRDPLTNQLAENKVRPLTSQTFDPETTSDPSEAPSLCPP